LTDSRPPCGTHDAWITGEEEQEEQEGEEEVEEGVWGVGGVGWMSGLTGGMLDTAAAATPSCAIGETK